jgi:membrane protein implicated in regulation of membrane protease activity
VKTVAVVVVAIASLMLLAPFLAASGVLAWWGSPPVTSERMFAAHVVWNVSFFVMAVASVLVAAAYMPRARIVKTVPSRPG